MLTLIINIYIAMHSRKVSLKTYNLFGNSELKHREFLLFTSRYKFHFIYIYSALSSTIKNYSEQKYFLTQPLYHTQVSGSTSPSTSISFCHATMPSIVPFRWQNGPPLYYFTLKSDFNTCLNSVEGLH